MIALRILLKSWAIPPASCPIDLHLLRLVQLRFKLDLSRHVPVEGDVSRYRARGFDEGADGGFLVDEGPVFLLLTMVTRPRDLAGPDRLPEVLYNSRSWSPLTRKSGLLPITSSRTYP